MASTTALWFYIETAFAEVEELCVEARAAEIAAQAKRDEARLLSAFGKGRTAPAQEPQAPPIESKLLGAFGGKPKPQLNQAPPPSDARYARAVDLANDLAFREQHSGGADLVEIRRRLRERLSWLKKRLEEGLSRHDAHYTVFPLVVHADELVWLATRGAAVRWEPLQSEIYETDNGGELFYKIIDERLPRDETPPILFEVFYFCLNDGFMGMYQGNPKKIDEYKSRLALRIPKKPVLADEQKDAQPVVLVPLPWKTYVAAAAAVLAGYLILTWVASSF